jgi:hypothetical protein
MRRPVKAAALFVGFAAISFFALLESRHRIAFGHFAPLGLHADVSVAKADIGIPGITKLYDARLTNFSIFPRRIERCEFLTDAFAHGVSVGYRIQQWDKTGVRWKTLLDTTGEYCRPYPLGIAQAQLTSKLLWPGQMLSTGEEATGARADLKGETMRFVVVANGNEFPTASFTIDERVQRADVGYPVRH